MAAGITPLRLAELVQWCKDQKKQSDEIKEITGALEELQKWKHCVGLTLAKKRRR
jgi:hypothetical protein